MQRRDQTLQIIRRHMQIAVGKYQKIMPSSRQHIDKIGYFTIRPVQCRIYHNSYIATGKASPHTLHDSKRGIRKILYAKDDLKVWIVLLATRRERGFQ